MPSTTPTPTTPAPPMRRTRTRRLAARSLLAIAALVVLASCTPNQMRTWYTNQGIDHSEMSEQQVAEAAYVATIYWAAVFAENAELSKFNHVLTDGQLYNLRRCESTDNYGAVSSTGLYRGAYQFHQNTWNNVARQHYPKYVGVDPARAEPKVQDAMTRALWSMTGPRSWPVCGYRV
ncbi:transglycosylase family protein [Rhabdothermincola salaria]|uniref:transglycosylase family protein n=1 Tax=Rhabdothermincola salaria TaxID=2903142 RepID=UPI0024B58108|nr:transglycosylase family protein [Rhabdothermincola salaria]